MKIIVGSRSSKLALTQTKWVIEQLQKEDPTVEFEIQIIKTKGDKIQDVSLDKIGDKGLFVKEIEEALLSNKIDMAIHSMKDMPSNLPPGLIFTECPIREDASDVLITPHKINNLSDLPQNAVIGTGSKRRKYQLLEYRPDLRIEPIRGNIDTRIKKLLLNNLDGIILAAAGVNRLRFKDNENYSIISIPKDIMVPAPAQGILAIEIKKEKEEIYKLISTIGHEKTNIQCKVERSFLEAINGSCHLPIGAYCEVDGKELKVVGIFGKEDGSTLIKKTLNGSIEDIENIGVQLAHQIKVEVNKSEG